MRLWSRRSERHQTLDRVRGVAYRDLIEAQVAQERANKASIEQRGFSVITTSGVLATLVFGLAAFAKQSDHINLDVAEKVPLITALVLFILAAAAGLWTNRPRAGYEEASIPRLQQRVTPHQWCKPDPVEAYRTDAKINVDILEAARKMNGEKAKWLYGAVVLEVLAVGSVAVAVAQMIVRA